jgi:long-chain acyl-CoA synthetase
MQRRTPFGKRKVGLETMLKTPCFADCEKEIKEEGVKHVNNVYLEKPWLRFYPPEVPHEVDIPLKSVNDLFDEATEKWKNRTALIFYGKKYSYGELREKVYRFATALHNLGIRKGDRVALLLLNSPEHFIAFYGIIRIGAIVTPVSPVYVASEVKHQLVDSGAEHIICQDMLYDVVEKTGVKLKNVILTNIGESLPKLKKLFGKSILRAVYQKRAIKSVEVVKGEGIWQFQELLNRYSPDPPKVEIDPNKDLLTLPYTGGTTGSPKGVMITNYCVVANAIQFKTLFSFLEEGKDCLLGYMPFYHAAGQFNFLLSGIFQGSTIVILTTPEIDDILHAIMRYKVTLFNGAPAVYEALKDSKKLKRVNWKRLKFVMSGADALNESTAKEWKQKTGVEIHDCYGMTELSPISHLSPLGRGKAGSMGIPIPNTAAAILDPDEDVFMPSGEIGELVVAGPNVCAGYWKNIGATKECEAVMDGIRWWRTGDLGKMDDDGYFYIYDRKRDLIKYKGLRVYAREVEEVLKTHPDIKSVGVIGQKDVKVGELVKAMVVLEADARGKLSEMEIMAYCKDKLASYKIPKIVEFVGEIPQTDVGKVSRRELREEGG